VNIASSPGASSWRAWLAVTLAVATLAALTWRFDYLTDDAFINFRYARNLAEGHGLRFNPGIEPAVEGYNLLWTLLMALSEWIGWNAPACSKWLNFASGAALAACVAICARVHLGTSSFGAWLTALFLVSLPPFAAWSTGGMETMTTALFVFATYERLLGDLEHPHGLQAGACAASAAMLRPDGAVLAGAVLLASALSWFFLRRKRLLRATLQAAAILGVCVACLVAWRLWYHGDWVSNTVRLKGEITSFTLERGWKYVVSFLLSFPGPLLVLLALPFVLRRVPPERSLPLLVLLAAYLCYPVIVGGDHMAMGRFLLVSLPFLALGFALLVRDFERRPRGKLAVISWTLLCIGLSLPASFNHHAVPRRLLAQFQFRWGRPFETEHEHWAFVKRAVERWTCEARAIARHTRAGESMAFGAIGAMGYHTRLNLFDMLGLTDSEARRFPTSDERNSMPGHTKHVPADFFLDRRPTYRAIVFEGANRSPRLLLRGDFALYPRGLIERVERHALLPGDGLGLEAVIALHHLVPLDADFEVWGPIFAAAEGLELGDPARAEAELQRRLPADSEPLRRVAAHLENLIVNHGRVDSPPQARAWDAAACAEPRLRLDVWCSADQVPYRSLPNGAIHLCLPRSGSPSLDGRAPGWIVMPPGTRGSARIIGGELAVVTLQP